MINNNNISYSVIDNFYDDPYAMREKAFQYKFEEPKDITGWRTTQGFIPKNLSKLVRNTLGRPIKFLEKPQGTIYDNGVFFLSFSKGKIKEKPCPHFDDPFDEHVCLVYLSENIPHDCGTSFFKHKSTGLESYPTRSDLRRLGMKRKDALQILDRDANYPNRWIETSRIAHKFNRAVIFPCASLHSATKHYGDSINNGRIYHLMTFKL